MLSGLCMSFYPRIKQFLLGRTLPTSAHSEERLGKAAALAVLSSDALSSVAYATEEILKVLVLAGGAVIGGSIWIALAISLLLLIITLSYQQTIRAYPSGGGAYIVAKDNLGVYPGLTAGAALMIDYVLTVTVSIASGVDNLTSIPALQPLRNFSVELCLLFIILIMLANLRGVKESGKIFMIPTYAFIVSVFIMIAVGFYKQATGQIHAIPPSIPATEPLGLFLILRAFSQGCAALTGVEAISNGVPAFKPPEWKKRPPHHALHGLDSRLNVSRHHSLSQRLSNCSQRKRNRHFSVKSQCLGQWYILQLCPNCHTLDFTIGS